MIYFDTNYFLRILLNDNSKQVSKVTNTILNAQKNKSKLISSTLVFFEIEWVLKSQYKVEKSTRIEQLKKILEIQTIDWAEKNLLLESLDLYEQNTISLEDCYHVTFAIQHNIDKIGSFDKKLQTVFKRIQK